MGLRLRGKNAVVTGSSRGIGKAIALALAAEGANVVVNGSGTDLKPLDDLVDEIMGKGGTAVAGCGSVADFSFAGSLIKTCVDNFGSIDILINCAGIGEVGTIVDVPVEVWQRVVDVHLNGTFNCCRHASALMVRQKRGRIINTASHAFLGIFGGTAYAASKGGIISLTRAMARDLKDSGVTCNAFCPGAKTRLSTGEEYEEKINALYEKGSLTKEQKYGALNPSDPGLLTPLVVYLSTDDAAHITGQVFSIAGGYIGLFPEPEEVFLGYKDEEKDGLWTMEEIANLEIG